LDKSVRQASRRAYSLFEQNPAHPSLRFKKLGGYERIWSVRINEQYRAVGERDGDTIIWFWIGTHNDFDNLFG
jgi:plasmid maintenance system killer protein